MTDWKLMDREQRGMTIAAQLPITRKGKVWVVPSQSGNGKYTVGADPENLFCSCPDHEKRGLKCKHIFAVEFAMKREQNPDGSTTTQQTVTVTETKRKTYAQNWPAYNAAQTHEKAKFQALLHDLCKGIEEPEQQMGRPRIPLADAIFSAAFKVYSTFSGRRFMSDLREAKAAGFISRVPSYASLFTCFESEEVTPILNRLIVESSLPLKAVEVDFAVDASGFTSSRFVRWFDHKYGVVRQQHEWVKVHLMCGVKTNVVTAVEIAGKNANSSPMLPALLNTTAKSFRPREISGDSEFGSLNNYNAIDAAGAVPFITFKEIHTGKGHKSCPLWSQMYHYFQFRQAEFLNHYHKRSNVESTFSMIKAKFRDHVRSKTDVAMRNEALCKILCHNICVLIQEMYELGIEPTFWTESSLVQKVTG
jgi:predicted nucleic acid-binding Zn finger protein